MEAHQGGLAKHKYGGQTIRELASELRAREARRSYHALAVAWDAICKHSITKLIESGAGVGFGALLKQVVEVVCNAYRHF